MFLLGFILLVVTIVLVRGENAETHEELGGFHDRPVIGLFSGHCDLISIYAHSVEGENG